MNILQFYLFSQLLLNNTLSLEAITNTAATSVNTSLSAYVQNSQVYSRKQITGSQSIERTNCFLKWIVITHIPNSSVY